MVIKTIAGIYGFNLFFFNIINDYDFKLKEFLSKIYHFSICLKKMIKQLAVTT